MSPPPITVVIPTRERGDVLAKSLRTVTAQTYPGLHILVSDNHSSDGTRNVVEQIGDPRIRYVNTGQRLSMAKNWEFALSHVEDGWVMILGDDDGLLPGALDRVAGIIGGTDLKAINATVATYIWPNSSNDDMGRLLVPMGTGVEVRNSRQWLRRVLNGRSFYSELPMMYVSGVIHNSLIRDIRERGGGTFFHSCMPDIFSAVSLASVTDKYLFSRRPFAIAGHSRHSNGASWTASSTSNSGAVVAPRTMFLSEANIPWHRDINSLPDGSVPMANDLLAYESYLQSAFLHNNGLNLTHDGQLAVLLARRIGDDARLKVWADEFASRHAIDVGRLKPDVHRARRAIRLASLRYNFDALKTMYRIEPNLGLPITDVFEASLVAGAVLALRPGLGRSYFNTALKQAKARLGRSSAAGRRGKL